MPGKHALLSASSAKRWLSCTPSARLEETLPEKQSEYAEEGSLAHAIAELKLRKKFIEPMGTRAFNNQLKKLKENPLYQDEMLKYTDDYVDYISGIAHGYSTMPYVAVEKQLDYSSYAPEGFGTGDCIIISGDTLHVIDLKYGKGVPVSAVDNPQMKLYALGAYLAYSLLYPIKKAQMAIVQPRRDSISEWETSIEDLLNWAESIKPIAQKAYDGQGDYVIGDHCQFCRANALCRARAEFGTAAEEQYKRVLPPLISNEEVAQLIPMARKLVKWAKSLEDYALAECLAGREISGWKAVEGRSVRQFTDIDAAFKFLMENGYDEALLYNQVPIPLTKVEELLGGKAKFKELMAPFVNRPPGKPTLVPQDDKREAIKQITPEQAFDETAC